MIQLNLLPDLKKEYLKSQKTKALVISGSILISIASLAVTALIAIYSIFGQQLQLILVNNDIKDRTTTLNNISDLNKYLTIQNQLAALPNLENGKGIYSRLLQFLPVLNPSSPNTVNLSNLSLDTTAGANSIILTGTTSSFQALNVFVDTLINAQVTYTAANATSSSTDKVFESVTVQSSALGETGNTKNAVSFTLNTVFNPLVFDARNTSVSVSVPSINTTPSVNGSPKSVFGQGGSN